MFETKKTLINRKRGRQNWAKRALRFVISRVSNAEVRKGEKESK